MLRRWVPQEYIAILNMDAPNKFGSKFMKQNLIELKGKVDISTNLVDGYHSHFPVINRPSRQKIGKKE